MEGSGTGSPSKPTPGLYLVATPIGNAADITLRALSVLRAADAIACEDTRVTRKLLNAHGVGTPMISYHEHNAAKMRPVLLERLGAGETIALVSDAGTPLISDPGYKLVRDCVAAGLPVTTLPGASAPVTAPFIAPHIFSQLTGGPACRMVVRVIPGTTLIAWSYPTSTGWD